MCAWVWDSPGSPTLNLPEDSSLPPFVSFPRKTASRTVRLEPAQALGGRPAKSCCRMAHQAKGLGLSRLGLLETWGSPWGYVSPENLSHPVPSCPRTFINNLLPKNIRDLPEMTLPINSAPTTTCQWEFAHESPVNRREASLPECAYYHCCLRRGVWGRKIEMKYMRNLRHCFKTTVF